MAFLDKDVFTTVIESTPLVSIDLVVVNEHDEVLLGRRTNKPAKGFWFVPGGRILKNETLSSAFQRLTLHELGKSFQIEDAQCLGPYEHFYDNSVFSDEISTHYVVLGYSLSVRSTELKLPLEQHNAYEWLTKESLLSSDSVHRHSKWYLDRTAV